jgi:tRNA/tmRNA/rRNA uracil-C5-methylase (TrmA/RlmC/RlmD family)
VAVEPGSLITLDVEKAAVGGRMLARHNGQVVLVWGAIPGERIRARIERVGRGVLYAETVDVLDASLDRRDAGPDWRCGGNVYAHVVYDRQVRLKAEIIRETLGRIGRLPLSEPPAVVASPERGYRMRARLHIGNGRLGYFREGTHELCDPAITGQLLPTTLAWIADVERFLQDERLTGLVSVELIENVPGDERACHLEFEPGTDPAPFLRLAGTGPVSDTLRAREGDPASTLQLRRSPRAFFQANRFLLERLVQHVVALVPDGPIVDLYAGVGLFGLSFAAAGIENVTLVEGDPASGADLRVNAQPFGTRVRVERRSVEAFLGDAARAFTAREADRNGPPRAATFIVDPPRTGMSKEAMAGIVRARAGRIIYISCDVATFARDTRTLIDAGYSLEGLTGMDLFPNSAHVESVAAFVYR